MNSSTEFLTSHIPTKELYQLTKLSSSNVSYKSTEMVDTKYIHKRQLYPQQHQLVGFISSPYIKIVASLIEFLSLLFCYNYWRRAHRLTYEPIYMNYPGSYWIYFIIPFLGYISWVLLPNFWFWLISFLFNFDLFTF